MHDLVFECVIISFSMFLYHFLYVMSEVKWCAIMNIREIYRFDVTYDVHKAFS